jgi:hypothetical protein
MVGLSTWGWPSLNAPLFQEGVLTFHGGYRDTYNGIVQEQTLRNFSLEDPPPALFSRLEFGSKTAGIFRENKNGDEKKNNRDKNIIQKSKNGR